MNKVVEFLQLLWNFEKPEEEYILVNIRGLKDLLIYSSKLYKENQKLKAILKEKEK